MDEPLCVSWGIVGVCDAEAPKLKPTLLKSDQARRSLVSSPLSCTTVLVLAAYHKPSKEQLSQSGRHNGHTQLLWTTIPVPHSSLPPSIYHHCQCHCLHPNSHWPFLLTSILVLFHPIFLSISSLAHFSDSATDLFTRSPSVLSQFPSLSAPIMSTIATSKSAKSVCLLLRCGTMSDSAGFGSLLSAGTQWFGTQKRRPPSTNILLCAFLCCR